MRPIVERIARLQRLAAFDAAARRGSFTAAATELGSTQPALTRQIRALERSVGLELFERTANRSRLTEAGRQLAAAVDAGFMTIEQGLSTISGQASTFVLASPPGFAQQVMVPVLDELHAALETEHAHDIRLWLYDRDAELDHGDADAIFASGPAVGWARCGPPVRRDRRPRGDSCVRRGPRAPQHSTADDVLAAPLLHMDTTDRPWMSWADWLTHFDLALTTRRRVVYNAYPAVIQQAIAGRGVALGWYGVIDQYLTDGLLVPVGPAVSTDRSYCLAWPTGRRTPAVEAVIGWLDAPDLTRLVERRVRGTTRTTWVRSAG